MSVIAAVIGFFILLCNRCIDKLGHFEIVWTRQNVLTTIVLNYVYTVTVGKAEGNTVCWTHIQHRHWEINASIDRWGMDFIWSVNRSTSHKLGKALIQLTVSFQCYFIYFHSIKSTIISLVHSMRYIGSWNISKLNLYNEDSFSCSFNPSIYPKAVFMHKSVFSFSLHLFLQFLAFFFANNTLSGTVQLWC